MRSMMDMASSWRGGAAAGSQQVGRVRGVYSRELAAVTSVNKQTLSDYPRTKPPIFLKGTFFKNCLQKECHYFYFSF